MKYKLIATILLVAAAVLVACSGEKNNGGLTTGEESSVTTAPPIVETSEITVDNVPEGNKYMNTIYNQNGIRIVFGVLGGQNLFEPNTDITFYAEISGKKLDKTEGRVTFNSIQLRHSDEKTFTLSQPDNAAHTYTGSFTAELNGIYTFTLILEDDLRVSFDIGVVPKNKLADCEKFYFGVQPYISRVYTWGNGYAVNGQTIASSEKSILNSIEWLGCNLVREDGVSWEAMQPSENSEINTVWMDKLSKEISEREMKLNWILGSTPKWAVKNEYLSLTDPNMYWSVCPDEKKWDKYVSALAEKYANNEDIIWEIWNEPDWEFFTGKPDDYINLLERTAKIFRSVNPDVHLYPGGLTVVNDPNDYRYKDSRPYFAGFKRLLDEKLIDTFAIHIHGQFNDQYFFNTLNEMTKQAEEAGLSMSGIYNTEAGLFENTQSLQAEHLMAKILYTRGHDYKMYVQYSFREFPASPDDGWAIFDTYLQPKSAAIAYAVLIGKLGQSEKTGTISDSRSLYADIYYDGSQSVVTVFNDGSAGDTLVLPEGANYKVYDMYGNPVKTDGRIKAELAAKYVVFEGKITSEMFSVEK